MTTITITLPRATVEQALEALESVQPQNMGPLIHPAKQALRAALAQQQANPAQQVVDEQAEDEALWFVAQTAPEAYLQQALRRLHAAVEGEK